MLPREDLTALLDQLIGAPHDTSVRSAVDAALSEIDDAELLAEVMHDFVVEEPVAEAIERRLGMLGSDNSRAWGRVARALAHYADTPERRQHVMTILRRALAANPNNTEALDSAILLWAAPVPDAPRDDLMTWSEHYVELAPQDTRAVNLRAKVLLKLEGDEAALGFLRERLGGSALTDTELADELRTLIRRIEAGEDVLQQWP